MTWNCELSIVLFLCMLSAFPVACELHPSLTLLEFYCQNVMGPTLTWGCSREQAWHTWKCAYLEQGQQASDLGSLPKRGEDE